MHAIHSCLALGKPATTSSQALAPGAHMGGLHGPALDAPAVLARVEHGPLPIQPEAKRAHTTSAASFFVVKAPLPAVEKRTWPGAAVTMQAQRMQPLLRKKAGSLAQGASELGEEVCNQKAAAGPPGRAMDSQHTSEARDAGQGLQEPPLRQLKASGVVGPCDPASGDALTLTPGESSKKGPPRAGLRESEEEDQSWGRWRQQDCELFDGPQADSGEPPPLENGSAEVCRPCDVSQATLAAGLHCQDGPDDGKVLAEAQRDQGTARARATVLGADTSVPSFGPEALLQGFGGSLHLKAQPAVDPQIAPASPSLANLHMPQLTQSQDGGKPRMERGRPGPGIGDSTPSLLVFSGARSSPLALVFMH